MASPPWFYYPFDELENPALCLSGEEVTHIIGARRLRAGNQLVLMNGLGKLAHCVLEEVNKKARTATLRVSLVAELEAPKKNIILACALPKGDRLSTMLDMACQLGMTQFQPLVFERSVNKWSDKLSHRCERVLIEACKQSKTARAPEVRPICGFAEFLNSNQPENALTLLADQFGRPVSAYAKSIRHARSLCMVVGPEGGLSELETRLAEQTGLASLRLAHAVLRIETAAVAAITALQSTEKRL